MARSMNLTALPAASSLYGVKPVTIYGLTTAKIAALAKEAVHDAVRDTVLAGVPVTGQVDGKVVTLQADDPMLAHYRAEGVDAKAA